MGLSYLITILIVLLVGVLIGATAILAEAKRRKQMVANMREYDDLNNIVLTNKRLISEIEQSQIEIASLKKREIVYKRQLVDWLKIKAEVSVLKEANRKQKEQIEQQKRTENERFGMLMRELLKHGIDLPDDLMNEITP